MVKIRYLVLSMGVPFLFGCSDVADDYDLNENGLDVQNTDSNSVVSDNSAIDNRNDDLVVEDSKAPESDLVVEDVDEKVNQENPDEKTEIKVNLNDYKNYITELDFKETEQEYLSYRKEGNFLFMKGTINSYTPDELEDAFNEFDDIKVIVMTYVGGSMDDEANLQASRFIREKNLITYLPSKGLIASGGTDFFFIGS